MIEVPLQFNVKNLASLATALINGDDNSLERLIVGKFEHMGEELLMQLMGQFVTSPSFQQIPFVQEYERTRQQFLNGLTPTPLPAGQKVLNALQGLFAAKTMGAGGPGKPARWERTDWATSRQDWLDNRWRHDWRSQPRDVRGRWIPGRLDYIASSLMYRGHRVGRLTKKKRRLLRARRKYVRKVIGGYISSFGRE